MEPQVKFNHAENMVAIRTTFPEGSPNAWGVMTSDRGGHYMTAEQAAAPEWVDVALPAAGGDE